MLLYASDSPMTKNSFVRFVLKWISTTPKKRSMFDSYRMPDRCAGIALRTNKEDLLKKSAFVRDLNATDLHPDYQGKSVVELLTIILGLK